MAPGQLRSSTPAPGLSTISRCPRITSIQSFSLISAILVIFRARPRLELSGSMEDNFTSTENDATIADSSESLEKDGSSTKNNCTGTEDDDLDVAEQELDEESIPMRKEGGWISP